MAKEKYRLYSLESTEELSYREARKITRLLWFTLGFVIGILLTFTMIYRYGN